MGNLWDRLRNYPALLLLVIVYLISCAVVFSNYMRGRGREGETKKTVLRLAHWQLEPGIRSAVDWLIDEYQKDHPDVEIKQILIPEEGYFRYVNTQLIGRTAPDMIECGLGGSLELWRKFYARYFMPLDQYVDEPNPYNEGTELEDTPWRQTYFDDMEGGYEETLQTYFRVPLSAFTLRLYYNKDMVSEVWDEQERGAPFPETYEGFIELCELLRDKHGETFVPISGSKYSFDRIITIYQTALTAGYLDRLDTDYDGTVSRMESAGPLYSGRLSMRDEGAIRANFELLREISAYSPPGATAMDRDEADFLFLQQQAAMMPTGSWDYQSLMERSEGEFTLGVADMPLPSKDHPKYGPYVAGPPTEADTQGAFPFAITKTSPNRDVALDFLQFASSLKYNEALNERMYWLPVIRGADPRRELEPFTPRIEGYGETLEYEAPGTAMSYEQILPAYLSGKLTYEEFAERYMGRYRRELPDQGVPDHIRDLDQTLDSQLRFGTIRRAAISGALGADAILTGDPEEQQLRIMEAFVGQRALRDHEVRVWVENARYYQQRQQQ